MSDAYYCAFCGSRLRGVADDEHDDLECPRCDHPRKAKRAKGVRQ